MDRQILNITANEQILTVDEPIRISTNKVNYIEAHFDLGQNWSGYDSVRAVWFNDFYCISTVLDSNGIAFVPSEVMKRNGKVKVNLVGSISEDDVLTDRLTSYPIVAVIVDCTAQINGAETAPTTPSQFEQYVAIVRSLVDSVKDIDHIELNSDYTLTIYYSDGTSDTTGSVRGADGNGIESVTKTGTSGLVDTYTITFTDGQATTFTVTNGAKGDTGNGIASIEKTSTVGLVDTYTITYTDGTTTTFTVTNGEKGDKGEQGDVSLAQLYAVYPTDTASGDIASFPDGADSVPMLSVVADIEPIQDLHGYDKPWSGGNGVNKCYVDDFTNTVSGLTIKGENEALTISGTASGTISANHTVWKNIKIKIPTDGTYYFTRIHGTLPSGVAFAYYDSQGNNIGISAQGNSLTAGDYTVGIYVPNGSAFGSDFTFKFVVATSSQTSWTPYSNICPISGRTECEVTRTGKNLLPNQDGSWQTASGTKLYITPSGGINLSAGTYYVGVERPQNDGMSVGVYAEIDGASASRLGSNGTMQHTVRELVLDEYANVKLYLYNSSLSDKQFRCILTNTVITESQDNFEPYNGHTYTTQFGQTVYGGSVDLVSGVLTVDRAMVKLDGTQTINLRNWRATATSVGFAYKDGIFGEKHPSANSIVANIKADKLSAYSYNDAYNGNFDFGIALQNNSSYGFFLRLPDPTLTSDALVNAWLAEHPLQVVYELATPTTIQLTPQEIDSFKGQNNLWASTGEIEVEYRADIGLYIEKKLS